MVKVLPLLMVCLLATQLLTPSTNNAEPYSPEQSHSIELPELGDSSSSLMSLQQEYQLGRAWLMSFRSQVKTLSDPLLQDYAENLVYTLATHSELKDRRLDVILVDNPTINAFAVPGGVVGIHSGLFLYAETESQMATVLGHELAHISQRHFARSVEAQKRNAIPNMAGLLAGIVLAATAGGDAGMAAIAATQAANLQNQLRYSRLHEQEADRLGMQTLTKAGFDPNAAATMFENMLKVSRFSGGRPPEFLLTHPVTESRISDTRNRSRQYPRKVYTGSLNYQLMRARVEVMLSENSKAAVNLFRSRLAKANSGHEATSYGLALALAQDGRYQEAQQQLAPLLTNAPNQIAYIVTEAEIRSAMGDTEGAINILQQQLAISPGSHPLTMSLAQSYLQANQPHLAESLLEAHAKQHPNNPNIWYQLAEAHGLAGDIVGVHRARAEFFVLNGVLDMAQKQLGYALPLVADDHLSTVKIKERIKQIEQLKQSVKKL
jgi:predicted Zn-dependent protease